MGPVQARRPAQLAACSVGIVPAAAATAADQGPGRDRLRRCPAGTAPFGRRAARRMPACSSQCTRAPQHRAGGSPAAGPPSAPTGTRRKRGGCSLAGAPTGVCRRWRRAAPTAPFIIAIVDHQHCHRRHRRQRPPFSSSSAAAAGVAVDVAATAVAQQPPTPSRSTAITGTQYCQPFNRSPSLQTAARHRKRRSASADRSRPVRQLVRQTAQPP